MHNHIYGFDYLRAILSIFVVVWHMGSIGSSSIASPSFAEHDLSFVDVVNFNLLLLAVPSFFLVSFYLYAASPRSLSSAFDRFMRFTILYVFWVLAYSLYVGGFSYLSSTAEFFKSSVLNAVFVFFSGARSTYYFFASLIVLVLVAHLCLKIRAIGLLLMLGLALTMQALLPLVSSHQQNFIYSVYWSPFNFLPYVFLGILLVVQKHFVAEYRKFLIIGFVICYLFASFLEWRYLLDSVHLSTGYAMPIYARASLVFGAGVTVLVCLGCSSPCGPILRFMSKYSLALFCIHPFLMLNINKLIDVQDVWGQIIKIVIVILGSYALAFMIKPFLSKKVLF
jgi:peptidoglycan/LPS O-acetylase OafA/YrhL